MKIIFLDFDGVIITYRSHYAYNKRFIQPEQPLGPFKDLDVVTCNFLRRICKYHNIKIVVSSTWRVNKSTCMDRLVEAGLFEYLHEDWRTIQSGRNRGSQIKEWLERHSECEDYLIIDDDNDMLEEQQSKFVLASMMEGLSSEGMRKIMRWIGTLC